MQKKKNIEPSHHVFLYLKNLKHKQMFSLSKEKIAFDIANYRKANQEQEFGTDQILKK